MPHAYDAIVVGLGAMGGAAAYDLARRGLRVLGVDAHAPPHPHGSHHGESRIIRTAYYEHPSYVPLLRRAFAAWGALEARGGRPLMQRTGALMIGRESGELVSGVLASVRAHALAHEVLTSRALMERYPFVVDDDTVAVWEADAGILFPEACVRALVDGARAAGANLRVGEAVRQWRALAGGVEVVTSGGTYAGGALVLAAGAGLGELVPALRPRLTIERQVVAHFEPRSAGRARLQPDRLPVFCLDEPDRAFYYGFPDLGTGCKVGRHHGGTLLAAGERAAPVGEGDIDDLRGFLRRHLPSLDGSPRSSATCLYTNTPDGHFVVDRHPAHENVVVASVCSGHGFKFAAVVGEIVGDLVQGKTPPFDLSMFRLARLAGVA